MIPTLIPTGSYWESAITNSTDWSSLRVLVGHVTETPLKIENTQSLKGVLGNSACQKATRISLFLQRKTKHPNLVQGASKIDTCFLSIHIKKTAMSEKLSDH